SMTKVALITGASRGIGAATAKYLARQNYSICINYKSQRTAAERIVAEIEYLGCHAIAVQADVSRETHVVRLFEAVDSELGPITHLVNNAGILLPQTTVENMSAQRINEVLTNNVTSYFLCSREAIKRMAFKNGGQGGAIVNVSSVA